MKKHNKQNNSTGGISLGIQSLLRIHPRDLLANGRIWLPSPAGQTLNLQYQTWLLQTGTETTSQRMCLPVEDGRGGGEFDCNPIKCFAVWQKTPQNCWWR